jgi:hypothetical protein
MAPKTAGALNIQIPTLKFQTNFNFQASKCCATSAEPFSGAWEVDSFLDVGCWNLKFPIYIQPIPVPRLL